MNISTPRGIARIKRLGTGHGARWYVFLPSTPEKPMGETYTFQTKVEAVNFAKSLQRKGGDA